MGAKLSLQNCTGYVYICSSNFILNYRENRDFPVRIGERDKSECIEGGQYFAASLYSSLKILRS